MQAPMVEHKGPTTRKEEYSMVHHASGPTLNFRVETPFGHGTDLFVLPQAEDL